MLRVAIRVFGNLTEVGVFIYEWQRCEDGNELHFEIIDQRLYVFQVLPFFLVELLKADYSLFHFWENHLILSANLVVI